MKTVKIGEEEYTYFKPDQVRDVPLKHASVRGYIPSLKPYLKGCVWNYESQLERDFLYLLDHNPNCIDLQTQPCEIPFLTKSNKKVNAFPDIWCIWKNGNQVLYEVKPKDKLSELQKEENWNLKFEAISDYCEKLGWKYEIVTEEHIRTVELNIVKDLLGAAKHFAFQRTSLSFIQVTRFLKQILEGSAISLYDLSQNVSLTFRIERSEAISMIKYLIYFSFLEIDWTLPLESTKISLPYLEGDNDGDEEKELENRTSNELGNQKSIEEHPRIYTDKEITVFNERYQLISPIIEQYNDGAKKKDVKLICEKNSLPFYTCYKWYLVWKAKGDEGLYPTKIISHAKSHIKNEIAFQFMGSVINEWYNDKEWTSVLSTYNDFYIQCRKDGLQKTEIPCKSTFYNWINKLPSVEKYGKYRPASQKNIPKGLVGTYQEGRYPGAVIQMDHTKLDIWLVDNFTKTPIGRPWISAGIDVFSRSVWGYFISFEEPNQESVLNAILRGLISKRKWEEWSAFSELCAENHCDEEQFEILAHGFPSMIQTDNGKDFQAFIVREYFMKNNITLEFRPAYTPNFGGYVEAPWDTINDAIRGAKLPGRVFPTPKSQDVVSSRKYKAPPGYDAKKSATLTLDEFRDWLFNYFSAKFCVESRASQQNSPNETWKEGLSGDNMQPMGGAVLEATMQEYQYLEYLTKRKAESVLNEKGLRFKNIYYTSPWLIDSRKKHLLKEKEKVEFRISLFDIRYIYIIDPKTNEVRTLEAYSYNGDDRILRYLLRAIGKSKGYSSFPISIKMLEFVKQQINTTSEKENNGVALMSSIHKKIQNRKKLVVKEQKLLEDMAKTKEGRQSLAEIVNTLQEKENQPESVSNSEIEEDEFELDSLIEEIRTEMVMEITEEKEVEGFETDWEVVKKKINWKE